MESAADGSMPSSAGGLIARPVLDQDARDGTPIERMSGPDFGARAKAGGKSRLLAGPHERERRAFSLGWKTSLLLDIAMIATPLPLVLAVPPYMECRERDRTVGFFVGDTVRACTVRGIRARWHKLDSRLKMIVRNSGQ